MSSLASPGTTAVGALLERALGGPVALLAFDRDGALIHRHDETNVAPELKSGFSLSPTLRAELRAGRRHALAANQGRWACVGAEGEDGVLWLGLVRAEPRLDLSRFAQHLVHAMRNSLSSVKLAAQTLSRIDELPTREKRRVAIAVREIFRMERTLSTASEYARLPTRQAERVELSALLRTAVAATQGELEARGVRVRFELPEPAPSIEGDGQRLLLCFENLLVFGSRAMPDGGELDLSLSVDRGTPLVTFRDRGAEITEDDKIALFTPLSHASRSAGLELPLLAAAVRELGGAIEAESAGPGLRLRIWLGSRGEGVHGHAASGR